MTMSPSSTATPDVTNRIDRLESTMSRLEGMLSMFIQGSIQTTTTGQGGLGPASSSIVEDHDDAKEQINPSGNTQKIAKVASEAQLDTSSEAPVIGVAPPTGSPSPTKRRVAGDAEEEEEGGRQPRAKRKRSEKEVDATRGYTREYQSGSSLLHSAEYCDDDAAAVQHPLDEGLPTEVSTPVISAQHCVEEHVAWPDSLESAAAAVEACTTKLSDVKEEGGVDVVTALASHWLTWDEVIGLHTKEEEEEEPASTATMLDTPPTTAEETDENIGGNLFPDDDNTPRVVASPSPAARPPMNARERKKEWFQSLYSSSDGVKATPCRYYAQGRCAKGDACSYSHDEVAAGKLRKAHRDAMASVPCKFYIVLGRGCREGDACRYSHEVASFPCVRESISGRCGQSGPPQSSCPMRHFPLAVRQSEVYKTWIMELYSPFIKERMEAGDDRVASLWAGFYTDTVSDPATLNRNFEQINTYIAQRVGANTAGHRWGH